MDAKTYYRNAKAIRHTQAEVDAASDLDTLLRLLVEDDKAVDRERREGPASTVTRTIPGESEIDWTSLPSFGGEPIDGQGIWSADATRLLSGTCAEDLAITPRVEHERYLAECAEIAETNREAVRVRNLPPSKE